METKTIYKWMGIGFTAIIGIVALIFLVSYARQHYNVWAQEMEGKAKLAESTQSRQILIEQAKAEDEAADYTVSAIKKVGEAAKKYPEYRQQMFIQGFAEALKEGTIQQIIYVPTEGNIPIMEAGKRPKE